MNISDLLNPVTSRARRSTAVPQTQQASAGIPGECQQAVTLAGEVPVTNISGPSTTSTANPTRYIIYGGPSLPGEPKTNPRSIPDIPEPTTLPNEEEFSRSIPPYFHESGPYELLDIRQVRTFHIRRITNAPPALPDCDLHKDYLEPRTVGPEVRLLRIWVDPPEAGENRRVAWLEDLKVDILPRIGAWQVSRNKSGKTKFLLTRYAIMLAPRPDRPLQWNWVTVRELSETMSQGWRQLLDDFRTMNPELIAAEQAVRQGVKRPREVQQPRVFSDGSSTEVDMPALTSQGDLSGNGVETSLDHSGLNAPDTDKARLDKRRKVTAKGKEKAVAADIPSLHPDGYPVRGESTAEAQLLADAQLLEGTAGGGPDDGNLSALNFTPINKPLVTKKKKKQHLPLDTDSAHSRHSPHPLGPSSHSNPQSINTWPQDMAKSHVSDGKDDLELLPSTPAKPRKKNQPTRTASLKPTHKPKARRGRRRRKPMGEPSVAGPSSNLIQSSHPADSGEHEAAVCAAPAVPNSNYNKTAPASKGPTPSPLTTHSNSPIPPNLPASLETQPATASESSLGIIATPSPIIINIKSTSPSSPPGPPAAPRRPRKQTINPRTVPSPALTHQIFSDTLVPIPSEPTPAPTNCTGSVFVISTDSHGTLGGIICRRSARRGARGTTDIPTELMKPLNVEARRVPIPSNTNLSKGKAPTRSQTNPQSKSKVTKPAMGRKRAGASSVSKQPWAEAIALDSLGGPSSSGPSVPSGSTAIASKNLDPTTTAMIADEAAVNALLAAASAAFDDYHPAEGPTSNKEPAVEKGGRGRPKRSLGKKSLMGRSKLGGQKAGESTIKAVGSTHQL